MDRANQYSRRNNLRISGVPESNDEDTDSLVLSLADSIGTGLVIDEIDMSHRVDRPANHPSIVGKPRDILIKFSTYRSRQKLYKRKAQLKPRGHPHCYVNDDITRQRSALLFNARKLKRDRLIQEAWSSDGNVLIKDNSGRIHQVVTDQDLDAYGNRRSYADVTRTN